MEIGFLIDNDMLLSIPFQEPPAELQQIQPPCILHRITKSRVGCVAMRLMLQTALLSPGIHEINISIGPNCPTCTE